MKTTSRQIDRVAVALAVSAVVLFAASAFRVGFRAGSPHAPASGSDYPVTYRDGPPAGFTGGFGEPTCQSCHDFNPLNEPSGRLLLSGLPQEAVADSVYTVTVTLTRPGLAVGGFQLGARFADGEQAGSFKSTTPATTVILGARKIAYSEHTRAGTAATRRDTLNWSQLWRAPEAKRSTYVHFNAAANASNDDNSEFGDFVYVLHDSVLVRGSGDGSTDE